jgi:pantothenate kinase
MAYEKDTYLEMIARGITYDEMLDLSQEDFRNLLLIRDEYNRTDLLEEMIDHEERTGSFKKTAKAGTSGAEQAILDIFDRQKGAHIIETFKKVKNALTEGDKEGIDLVQHAIYAKAASDHVGLKNKLDKENNNN